jgi:hypothetical protein
LLAAFKLPARLCTRLGVATPGLAGALAEGVAVLTGDADVVAVAAFAVGDLVEARSCWRTLIRSLESLRAAAVNCSLLCIWIMYPPSA